MDLKPSLKKILLSSYRAEVSWQYRDIDTAISRKVLTLQQVRLSNAEAYLDFLKFCCDIGRLDLVYLAFNYLDKESKSVQSFIEEKTEIKRIKNFSNDPYIHELQLLSLQSLTMLDLYSLKKKLFNYFKDLKPETASHYENMVLNFLLFLTLDNKEDVLDHNECTRLFNHFFRTKNANRLRRDNCYFLILDYCLKNNIKDYFILPKKLYNHLQRTLSRFNSNLLLEEDKKYIMDLYLDVIRENNSFSTYEEKPKIAVCISGIYRGHEESLQAIRETIIEPFNADVFIHTWDEMSVWSGLGGSPHSARIFGHDCLAHIPDDILWLSQLPKKWPNTYNILHEPINQPLSSDVIKSLNPVAFEVEDEKEFISSLGDLEGYTRLRPLPNQIKMFYGIKRAFDLALNEKKYDYIIRVRPDILLSYHAEENFLDKLENNFLYTALGDVGLGDSAFIMSSSMAFNFSNFVDKILNFGELSIYKNFPLYDSHNLLGLWLLSNNYKIGEAKIGGRVLPNASIKLPGLKEAMNKDYQKLSLKDKKKYKPFFEYLMKRNG